MNRWRWLKGYIRAYSGASITKKAIAIYIAIIFIPGCLLFFVYYHKTSSIIEQEMSASMMQTLNQVEYNVSNGLDNIVNVSDSVIANQTFVQYLSHAAMPAYEQFEDFQQLEKLITSLERNRFVHRIRLFVDPNLTYSNENIHFFSLHALDQQSTWYRNMIARNGANYWRGTYLQAYLGEADTYVISALRMLHDPLQYETVIGVLSVDVKVEMIQEILDRVSLSSSQEVFIVDSKQQIIAHQDATIIGQQVGLTTTQIETIFAKDEGSFRDDSAALSYLYHRIPNTDWVIITKLPTAELSGNSVVLTKISAVLLLGIGSVIFIFFLVLAFGTAAESLAKRIRDMNRSLKAEGASYFDGSLPKPKGDLRQLENAISRMVQTVHDLTAESYRSQLHKRDAELKALQAQVDPHFLYNTLDSMNWMAIRRGAVEISDLIGALSTYFRLSLNKGRDVITLADELQLIQSYMHIHNTRDDSGIEIICEVETTLLACQLPKHTLQPIIENAVLHGIHMKRPKRGTITVSAKLEQPKESEVSEQLEQLGRLRQLGQSKQVIPSEQPEQLERRKQLEYSEQIAQLEQHNQLELSEQLKQAKSLEQFARSWLIITIQDDGVGISPEQTARLLDPPSMEKQTESYGLYNVHERLRLFSQDQNAGVTIHSQLGIGTTVMLKLKVWTN